jgi:hypothetical protein
MRRTLGAAIGVALAMTACILWFFMLFVSPWGMLVGIIVNTTILVGLTRDRRGEEQWHSVYD